MVVELPHEQAAIGIAERAILVKRVIELWGEGPTLAETVEAVKAYPVELMAPYFRADMRCVWCATYVHSTGAVVSLERRPVPAGHSAVRLLPSVRTRVRACAHVQPLLPKAEYHMHA